MLTGRLNWQKAQQYNWESRDYIDIPFEFEGYGSLIPGNDSIAPAGFNLVIRKLGNSFEGAVRTAMAAAVTEDVLSAASKKVFETYQLISGEKANIWQRDAAQPTFLAVNRKDISAAEFLTLKLKYKGMSLAAHSGERLMLASVDYCILEPVTTYETICWEQNGDPMDVACTAVAVTYYVESCSDSGGGGSGGSSYPPSTGGGGSSSGSGTTNTTDDSTDPCAQAATNNATAKNLLNGQYKDQLAGNDLYAAELSAFAEAAKLPQNTVEKSISIKLKTSYTDGMASTQPTYQLGTTSINTGTATIVETTTQVSESGWTVIAGIHTHPVNSFTAPSVKDLYSLYNANTANPDYQYQFVFAADGSRYVYTITDATAFTAFITSHPEGQYVDADNAWNKNTQLGTDYQSAYTYLLDQYGSNPTNAQQSAAYETALAYSLSQNNTGVSLSKMDSNGEFKSIFVNKDADQNKKKYNKVTVTNDCNL
ncbi:MAG: hypothetical protein QM640_05590 [Niabella sp.]